MIKIGARRSQFFSLLMDPWLEDETFRGGNKEDYFTNIGLGNQMELRLGSIRCPLSWYFTSSETSFGEKMVVTNFNKGDV